MNALAQEVYKPVVLPPHWEVIRKFCLENPHVCFNAPPDYQPEFHKAIEGLQCATVQTKYLYRQYFYANRPMIDYLKKIKEGDMCLFFVLGKKSGGLTSVARIDEIYDADDLPPNWRVDINPTRRFRRYFGGSDLWTGSIVAMTRVSSLKKEMCWRDPEAKIFMEKAAKHGIA